MANITRKEISKTTQEYVISRTLEKLQGVLDKEESNVFSEGTKFLGTYRVEGSRPEGAIELSPVLIDAKLAGKSKQISKALGWTLRDMEGEAGDIWKRLVSDVNAETNGGIAEISNLLRDVDSVVKTALRLV